VSPPRVLQRSRAVSAGGVDRSTSRSRTSSGSIARRSSRYPGVWAGTRRAAASTSSTARSGQKASRAAARPVSTASGDQAIRARARTTRSGAAPAPTYTPGRRARSRPARRAWSIAGTSRTWSRRARTPPPSRRASSSSTLRCGTPGGSGRQPSAVRQRGGLWMPEGGRRRLGTGIATARGARAPDTPSSRGRADRDGAGNRGWRQRALKYFASGWCTTRASVDCSGCSCSSSLSSTPIRSGRSSETSLARSSRSGQAG
jgi:hypothetical protein